MNVRSVLFLSAALLCFSPLSAPAFADDHEEYEMTEDQITKVQTLLVEWGYSILGDRKESFFIPNGRLGPKTQKAIAKVQKSWGERETGFLTRKQYKKIIDWGMPDNYTWGALAVATDGAYGVASDYSSGIEAYLDAQKDCREDTDLSCDHAIAWYQTPKTGQRFIVAVWCEGKGYASAAGHTSSDALDNAYALLFKSNYHRSDCNKTVTMSLDDGEE